MRCLANDYPRDLLLLDLSLLLEVMIDDENEPVTGGDRRRFHAGQAWFAQRSGQGIPMEDVLAEFGLKTADFPLTK
jgi:hypothetical protein